MSRPTLLDSLHFPQSCACARRQAWTLMSATFNSVNTQQTGIVPKIKYIHFTNIFTLTAQQFLLCIFKCICHFQAIRCLVVNLSFNTEKRALTAVLFAQCLRIGKITPVTLIWTAKNWNNMLSTAAPVVWTENPFRRWPVEGRCQQSINHVALVCGTKREFGETGWERQL